MSFNIKHVLAELLATRLSDVNSWLEAAFANLPTPIYGSVDMRFSGPKFVPVDYNMFPAGFNNLGPTSLASGSKKLRQYLQTHYPDARHIGLITEYHTRNQFYQLNIAHLVRMLEDAGYQVSVAPLLDGTAIDPESPSPAIISLHHGRIAINDNPVDVVILNNDLSAGLPEIFTKATTPTVPSPQLGWYRREKAHYFAEHQKVIAEFCAQFGLDPFYLSSTFRIYNELNFHEAESLEKLADIVEKMLGELATSYKAYNLIQTPYLLVKANSGTYGMGIMVIKSAEEVRAINKKSRHRMYKIKSGRVNDSVIIQEGIESIDQIDNHPAEPMAYLVGNEVIGNFWRVNQEAGSTGNLNSRGMYFTPSTYNPVLTPENLVARLAALAASREYYVFT